MKHEIHHFLGFDDARVEAVVMHLDGVVGPANLQSPALSSGSFLVGLRAISSLA